MRCLDGLPQPGSCAPPTAVTVGVFDGLHKGHRALLQKTCARARELSGEAVAFTFREHPDGLLRGAAPRPLMTLGDRLDGIAAAGIDCAVVANFTPELRNISVERFAREVLEDGLGCKSLVMGHDSAICHHREGTVERFREHGIDAERIDRVVGGGDAVSSSAIRDALVNGDVARAAAMLGRSYELAGTVVRGEQRGRELGFPTANVEPPDLCLPERGVYAVRATFAGVTHPAVANLGTRPTVDDGRILLEVHVLDWSGDLAGEELRVAFVTRLRDEQRFDSIDALRAQIAADAGAARAVLGTERHAGRA